MGIFFLFLISLSVSVNFPICFIVGPTSSSFKLVIFERAASVVFDKFNFLTTLFSGNETQPERRNLHDTKMPEKKDGCVKFY